jgi:excisionase family DNA binding protein
MVLLTPREVAEALRLSVRTVERLRATGEGPEYIRFGSSVRYDRDALARWLAERKRRSTSEPDREMQPPHEQSPPQDGPGDRQPHPSVQRRGIRPGRKAEATAT